MSVARFDSGTIRAHQKTPQGYLRLPAVVARTGVITYRNPDGSLRRELRHPDDVFDKAALALVAGIPVTDEHPFYVGGPKMLDASSTSQWMRGYTGDAIRVDGDFVVADGVTITDESLIAKIDRGESIECSLGYLVDIVEESGDFNGDRYDYRQRNIRANHLAITARGRQGPEVCLRLDSDDAVQVEQKTQDKEKKPMEKITLAGKVYDVQPELAASLQAHLDSLKGEHETALVAERARADKAEGRCDSLAEDIKKAQAELKAARLDSQKPEIVRAAVKARVAIESVANRVLTEGEIEKLDSMEDIEIKRAVIKADSPQADLDGKPDAYIDARYDSVVERLDAIDEERGEVGKRLHRARLDRSDVGDEAEKARKRQDDATSNAWKGEQK